MQGSNRQSKKLAKRAGMFDDTEQRAARAVAAEPARAPCAAAVSQIDFTRHAGADPGGIFSIGAFAGEFVSGRAGEAVVAALQLEIGRAYSGGQQTNPRESLGNSRQWAAPDVHS